ncbi:integrase catalytic domain-containing protein [Trichonephila clavipes]|nr:integrase catalytic domain-containing protein [Trichonephila clavipes]
MRLSYPTKKGDMFPRLERGIVPINIVVSGVSLGFPALGKYEYVDKLLPSLEHTFNKVLNNLRDQEASHVELSTRVTKQHHYDYKIGSLCFIKTPNIKSNLSPKLRPKFEGPYRVIERFSNVNYRVQHVEQLRKIFNTHVNRMIPFIKRFSYLHLNNLEDLQPEETEVKGIVPGPRYNLRARAGNSAH